MNMRSSLHMKYLVCVGRALGSFELVFLLVSIAVTMKDFGRLTCIHFTIPADQKCKHSSAGVSAQHLIKLQSSHQPGWVSV